MTILAGLLTGVGSPVLQTCRFEGLGGELYGREAIGDRLSALNSGLTAALIDSETARLGVWMDADHGLIADLVEGHVQRLWLFGDTVSLSPTPVIDIPIDTDLAQARWDVRFEPRDHPELDVSDQNRLLEAVGEWPGVELTRSRPLVLRAASVGTLAIALVRLEGEVPGASPVPTAFNGLVVLDGGSSTYRTDGAGRTTSRLRRWKPSL